PPPVGATLAGDNHGPAMTQTSQPTSQPMSQPTSPFNDAAQKKYAVQDYKAKRSIEGLELVQLKRFNDDGGSMTELARLDGGLVQGLKGFQALQINYSTMEPLAIKAFHLHKRQTDV